VAVQRDITIRGADVGKVSFDPGFRFDVAIGGGSESWRAEFEFGFIYNSVKSFNGDSLNSEGVRPDVYELPMMVNVIYKLPFHGPVTAYVGAGIGGVYGIFVGSDTSILGFTTDITFGYQGLAGVKYAVSDRCDLGVAYKFLGTTEHDLDFSKLDGTMTHSLLATLSFKF